MNVNNKTKGSHRFIQGDKLTISQPRILLVAAENEDCLLVARTGGREEHFSCGPGRRGLLILTASQLKIISGAATYRDIPCTHLAKLQVFIDQAVSEESVPGNTHFAAWLPTNITLEANTKEIEYGYLNQAIVASEELRQFTGILRNTEWYRLVSFLLNESNNNSNGRLKNMCVRYGLSVAHFRRLSSHALGNTTKSELRDWRLSRALFELVGEEKNLTAIAMNHGYASLSHFANEIKNLFGVSPKGLKNIIMDDVTK